MAAIAAVPELIHLTSQVVDLVQGIRTRAERAETGRAEVEPAAQAAFHAEDVLGDVVRETKILLVREHSARNRLRSAALEARREEREAEATARALDRREQGSRAAVKAAAKAMSQRRDAEQFEDELVEAEGRVAEVEEFWETVSAVQEDVERTVGRLRRRYEAAERLVAVTRLGEELQHRLDGVGRLTRRVHELEADARAERDVQQLDPAFGQGYRRRAEAEDQLRRWREQQ